MLPRIEVVPHRRLLYRPAADEVLRLRSDPWLHQHDGDVVSDSGISVRAVPVDRGTGAGGRGANGMRVGRAGSRCVLLGLLAVFAAPIVFAFVFHAGAGSWFAPAAVNRAELLEPPRFLPAEPAELVNGEALPADHFDRRWTLVHLAAGGCAEDCAATLRAMRQAHLALGRYRTRVQRLLLIPAGSPSPGAAEADHPVGRVTPAWRQVLRIPGSAKDGAKTASGLWLVDPRRFVISYFPSDTGPRAIKHDLTRLLRLSRWQTG